MFRRFQANRSQRSCPGKKHQGVEGRGNKECVGETDTRGRELILRGRWHLRRERWQRSSVGPLQKGARSLGCSRASENRRGAAERTRTARAPAREGKSEEMGGGVDAWRPRHEVSSYKEDSRRSESWQNRTAQMQKRDLLVDAKKPRPNGPKCS